MVIPQTIHQRKGDEFIILKIDLSPFSSLFPTASGSGCPRLVRPRAISGPELARHAAALGNPLRDGDLVASGSWTGIYWGSAGVQVEVEFAGVGRVALST